MGVEHRKENTMKLKSQIISLSISLILSSVISGCGMEFDNRAEQSKLVVYGKLDIITDSVTEPLAWLSHNEASYLSYYLAGNSLEFNRSNTSLNNRIYPFVDNNKLGQIFKDLHKNLKQIDGTEIALGTRYTIPISLYRTKAGITDYFTLIETDSDAELTIEAFSPVEIFNQGDIGSRGDAAARSEISDNNIFCRAKLKAQFNNPTTGIVEIEIPLEFTIQSGDYRSSFDPS